MASNRGTPIAYRRRSVSRAELEPGLRPGDEERDAGNFKTGPFARDAVSDDAAAPLREAWYYATPSRRLRRGKTMPKIILGEPILLGRDNDGTAFALRDLCPHRGMRLTAGRFDGYEVECCYHGWRFDTDGHCTLIPSLAPGQTAHFQVSFDHVPDSWNMQMPRVQVSGLQFAPSK